MTYEPREEMLLCRLGIVDPRLQRYLIGQTREMKALAISLKAFSLGASPSEIDGSLSRIAKNPRPLLSELLILQKTERFLVQPDCVVNIVLFYYAMSLTPSNPERHLVRGGDVLKRLEDEADPAIALSAAALMALRTRSPDRQYGRGGARRWRHEALKLAVEHALEIYRTATGRIPGFTVESGGVLRGPAVDFLEYCLPLMGQLVSLRTIRRLIETNRTRMLSAQLR